MQKVIFLGCILLMVSALRIDKQHLSANRAWNHFKQTYGLNIQHQQEEFRKAIFEHNLAKIEVHNADPYQTYKMGVNHFTIYTQSEFVHLFLQSSHFAAPNMKPATHLMKKQKQMHLDVDWALTQKVSPVKNQGACNAGWAFAATGVIQSFYLIKGTTIDLSQQQLIDCSRPYGNQGCTGGWALSALNYIKGVGIQKQTNYPYIARDQTCKISGGPYVIVGYGSYLGCNALLSKINSSPVAVNVDATNWSPYKSGVFNNCASSINHGVLLVGVVNGNWKLKNDWGNGWGQNGYIRLANGNTCGICNYAGVAPY